LAEDAGLEERLDQRQDTLVGDASTHPGHKRGVVDLVKARRDVALQHPGVGVGAEVVDLGDGVLGAPAGSKPIGARVEVGLEDRFEDQLQGGLDDPVFDRGDGGFKLHLLQRVVGLGI